MNRFSILRFMMNINKLSQEVIDIINRQTTIVVVATVDEDGSPRTAPFGWVYAKDGGTLRLSMSRSHNTYKNIVRDGRVMVCLIEEGNIAISIKGNAQVCKEQLNMRGHCAMVEVYIKDVKNDITSVTSVIQGIKCKINERYVEITNNVYTEMME